MGKIEIDTSKSAGTGMSFRQKRHIVMMFVALIALGWIVLDPYIGKDKNIPAKRKTSVAAEKGKVNEGSTKDLEEDLVPAAGTAGAGIPLAETEIKQPKKDLLKDHKPGMVIGDGGIWKKDKPDGTVSVDNISQAMEFVLDLSADEIKKIVSKEGIDLVFNEDNTDQRGRMFSVQGILANMQNGPITLGKKAARKLPVANSLFKGIMVDEKTGKKIAVVGSDVGVEYIMKRRVRMNGLFCGLWTVEETQDILPLFVFKKLRRLTSNPLEGVTSFAAGQVLGDPDIWAMADDELKEVMEEEPYYHALDILSRISQKDLQACVDSQLQYEDLFLKSRYPKQQRGKVVTIEGILLRLEERRVSMDREVSERLPNAPWVYVGQIQETNSRKFYTFRTLEMPDNVLIGDFVRIPGIYVKVYIYPNQMGEGHFTKTPLVMGKTFYAFKRKTPPVIPIVGTIGLVIFMLIMYVAFLERKRSRAFTERLSELQKRRRERKAAEGTKGSSGSGEKESSEDSAEEKQDEEKTED